MTTKPVETQFAPAERASVKAVFEQSRCFSNSSLLRQLFDASPTLLMGLNEHRQIVFANQSMFNWLGPEHNEDTAYGLRPGEALDCAHAFESEGGCGTTQFCRTCGAVQAILAGLHGREAVKECRITQRNGNALDLRVWATPLELNGNLLPGSKPFIAFAVSDISHEKRRRALERIFFHDILNTASGLQGVSELLKEAGPDELDELKEIVAELAGTLIGEINAQKLLSEVESGELAVNLAPVNAVTLLQEVITLYKNHHVAKDRTLRLAPESETAVLHTDKTLLKRVIGNMTKNALEAAEPDQTGTLGCAVNRSAGQFWVHNPTF
ncbi:MAG: histidine kinase, partial [Anaerolineae bacterium]